MLYKRCRYRVRLWHKERFDERSSVWNFQRCPISESGLNGITGYEKERALLEAIGTKERRDSAGIDCNGEYLRPLFGPQFCGVIPAVHSEIACAVQPDRDRRLCSNRKND